MKEKNRKVPKLRFPGFNDDWEQRKLGEVIEDYVEKSTVENQYPVLTSSQQMGIVLQDEYFAGQRVSQGGNVGYFIIPRGYFAYRSRSDNDVFVFNRNDAIDTGIISYFYPVFKPKNVDSDFLLRRLNYGLEQQIKINSEGTGQHVLSLKKFKNMQGLFPQMEEQRKIGTFFENLDNLITLHQRKLDDMKEYKKGMLQKMFPQKGQSTPEIRFPGFTAPWEQRKLNEYLAVSKAKNKEEVFGKEDVLSVSGDYGIVNQIEFQGRSFAGVSVAAYGVVETGDVVYTKSPLKANPYGIIKTNKGKPGIVSTLYAVYKPLKNTCPEFVQIYFEQDARMNNYMHPLVNKGAKNDMKVSAENALKGTVIFPSKEEQTKISEHFELLDNLITLHQRKIDEMKEFKKGLLQQMFV